MATGLCLMLVAPLANAVSANASSPHADAAVAPALGPLVAPPKGAQNKNPNGYSGYYENVVGALTLTTTITVPTMKCTNSATWGTSVGLVALMNSTNPVAGTDQHGGGVEVGCASVTGTPTYAAALCDPDVAKGCGTVADPVDAGDIVGVTVNAGTGCHPTCASLVVTVHDSTKNWTESWSGTSQSDFDTFVVAVGFSPLANFGKVTLSNVTANGHAFQGRRFNLVDTAGHTLARAGNFNRSTSSFNVKWLRAS